MFKITPVNDKSLQKSITELCGGEFKQDFFCYVMTDLETGEVMGYSQFEISSGTAFLADLKEAPSRNDFEAMFILGRQTLNFIDLCGVHNAYAYKSCGDKKLLHAIGFRDSSDDKMTIDLNGMFDGKCSGHKVEL